MQHDLHIRVIYLQPCNVSNSDARRHQCSYINRADMVLALCPKGHMALQLLGRLELMGKETIACAPELEKTGGLEMRVRRVMQLAEPWYTRGTMVSSLSQVQPNLTRLRQVAMEKHATLQARTDCVAEF